MLLLQGSPGAGVPACDLHPALSAFGWSGPLEPGCHLPAHLDMECGASGCLHCWFCGLVQEWGDLQVCLHLAVMAVCQLGPLSLPLPLPSPPLPSRYDPEHRAHCCSMCITFILLTVVIVGEVLIVAAGDTGMLPWRAAFTPFYLLFVLSCSVCFWSVWKCRSCEVSVVGWGGLGQVATLTTDAV